MNNNPEFKQALMGIYKDGCKKFNIRTTPKDRDWETRC